MKLQEAIVCFAQEVAAGRIEVYNEFSVQFELAMFLRSTLPAGYRVQLERNVEFFGLDKSGFLKKEMDIVVFSENKKERSCIEIKYPTNGQHPEQMFSIIKDVGFFEQLTECGFSSSYSLVFADDPVFFSGRSEEGNYGWFRAEFGIWAIRS